MTIELNLAEIKKEVTTKLADKEIMAALIATTFKGLNEINVKKAIVEGMMRKFTFEDFLQKNVYAIPFGGGYSLVTSIDYARKIGMRSGVVGTSAPTYEEKDGKPVSCTVTVKRKIEDYIGDYSATVFFDEYNTGRNQWTSKPRTMIAKVAEMHALRKACPEELAQSYAEEEVQLETKKVEINIDECKKKLESSKNLQELRDNWASLPAEAKETLKPLKEELKKQHESIEIQ